MSKKLHQAILLPAILLFSLSFIQAQQVPKNVIVLIGDGMGYNQVQSSNLYHHGKFNAQPYEQFPVSLFMSTYPAQFGTSGDMKEYNTGYSPYLAWSDFDYVLQWHTDSAPAATTMATGKKTYSKSIGMDVRQIPIENLTEFAKRLGKSAGVVSNVPLSHATPAGFATHNVARSNYEEIALSMFLDSRLDVIMGAGHPEFDNDGKPVTTGQEYKYVGGRNTWQALKKNATEFPDPSSAGSNMVHDCNGDGIPDPWTLYTTKSDFEGLPSGATPIRVLGIPEVGGTLQQARSGRTDIAYAEAFNQNVPSLATMAAGALNVLDNNPAGFFLMIEGGAIDWACHDNQPGRLIEEQDAFNQTIATVIQWVESHGGWDSTLVIVTADHETGYLTGPKERDNSPVTNPLVGKGRRHMPDMRFNSDGHSNQLVPFYAKGMGNGIFSLFADEHDPVRGYYLNNSELAQAVFILWGKWVNE